MRRQAHEQGAFVVPKDKSELPGGDGARDAKKHLRVPPHNAVDAELTAASS